MAETSSTRLPQLSVSSAKTSTKHRTLWQDTTRRFFRNRLAILGLVIVVTLLFVAISADFLAPYPYDYAFFTKVLLAPFKDPDHTLGTDNVGRDYLSRLIYGARTSLLVGLCVQVIALTIGIPLGGLAGYLGGKVDFLISRLIDVFTAFPGLLFAIFLLSIWGGGLWNVIFILGITSWIGISRLVRGQLLSLREKEFIEAARCLGTSQGKIIYRHLIPNALTPILVTVSFGIPAAIFAEAGLSFLGLGINEPIPSWGRMVGISTAYLTVNRNTLQGHWHLALFPTLLIALTMLGFSFLGDGLRDALDPKLVE
jgi:oligopeptide transport system permease protein